MNVYDIYEVFIKVTLRKQVLNKNYNVYIKNCVDTTVSS